MFFLYEKVPKYLLGKYQLISTVMFTALFTIVFLVLGASFVPIPGIDLFSAESTKSLLACFAAGVASVAVSRRIMYTRQELTYLQYISWCIVEVVIVAVIYVLFFTVDRSDFTEKFLPALFVSTVCLGVPYVVAGFYFAVEDKNNTIRLMNFANVVSDMQMPAHEEQRITLFDNTGVLKFSIKLENLFFIESDDNYIKVWYSDSSGEIKQYMLRCRLKTVEDSFSGSDLVRCHRKYMVNMGKVSILSYRKDTYFIDLGLESVEPIPVSKTYEQAILSRFNSR